MFENTPNLVRTVVCLLPTLYLRQDDSLSLSLSLSLSIYIYIYLYIAINHISMHQEISAIHHMS